LQPPRRIEAHANNGVISPFQHAEGARVGSDRLRHAAVTASGVKLQSRCHSHYGLPEQ